MRTAYSNELNFNSIKNDIDKIFNNGDIPILEKSGESILSKTKGHYIHLSSENYSKSICSWTYKRSTHRNKAILKLNIYIQKNYNNYQN